MVLPMRISLVLACLWAVRAVGENPATEPTAYACDAKTLVDGRPCVFEADEAATKAAPGRTAANQRWAKELAYGACKGAAKSSWTVRH